MDTLQKTLDDHVKQVRLSTRLTQSPVCLVGAEQDYSPQLEKLLASQGGGSKSRRILELNPEHQILHRLKKRYEQDDRDPLLEQYAELLYGQALLSEGSELPDPGKFSQLVADLMLRDSGDGATLQEAQT